MTVEELVKYLDGFHKNMEVRYDSEITGADYSISGVEMRRYKQEKCTDDGPNNYVLIL